MDPAQPNIKLSDVVRSTTGRDCGELYYVVSIDGPYLALANGRDRTLDRPKRKKQKHVEKILRSETRVAEKLASGSKVLNSELRKELAELSQQLQSNNLGG